jgi:hypothetical protein
MQRRENTIPEVPSDEPIIRGAEVLCDVCGRHLPGYSPVRDVDVIIADPKMKALVKRYSGLDGIDDPYGLQLADAWKRGHPHTNHPGRLKMTHDVCGELQRTWDRLERSVSRMHTQWAGNDVSDQTIDAFARALFGLRNTVRTELAPGWKKRHRDKGRHGKPAPRNNPHDAGMFGDLGHGWKD